ncbi:DUF934 domain-containing protein [Bordetella avium]|uniref:Oxidoreductase n=1 Tax=Bordetella avium (strain 197N) TaxID=360910 RepID=Q2KZY2_BORA1|nr:DUF934 domain-containing protein [Bordetella avium]AZY51337.1 DUF934 domain-containing protein [Bordetella avium]RIQ14808.1 DUF934 domain-containing protein [Bordetella avium]RIQ41272.1 DUF934 domain-containing protein [Bordetella avium]RIQ45941.1 DUF934 domain-containing protein [Bordetella avium]RIQ46867.1 DUF934 domain-containing protein [Bordetella avium]
MIALSLPQLIRQGRLQNNAWRLHEPQNSLPPDEAGWSVNLPLWLAQHQALAARQHPVGLQLGPDAELKDLGQTLARTPPAFIAIEFPVYTDGRGYSLAQWLRRDYGWQGELRAVGDVMIDTIYYQARVGFDSFLLKAGHDPEQALQAFSTFSVRYQQTYPTP